MLPVHEKARCTICVEISCIKEVEDDDEQNDRTRVKAHQLWTLLKSCCTPCATLGMKVVRQISVVRVQNK